ncbi:MAG: hypothetical protein IKX39_05265 [Muribaculaceae bacterium]|nr:hypothetical protein [Muribaculaceae bacterium]
MKKILLLLTAMFVFGLAAMAQKQYVNIIATGQSAREGISLSGAIPAGMQDYYTSYYGNIVTLGDVINELAQNGFVVERMSSDCASTSNGMNYREIVIMSKASAPEEGALPTVSATDPNATEIAHYNLQGLPVDANEKGVHIVVYSDYTARTVVVE